MTIGGVAADHEEKSAVRLLSDPKKPRAPRKPKPPPVTVALPTVTAEDCGAAVHHPQDAGALLLLPLEGTVGNNEREEETVTTTAPSYLEKGVAAVPEEDEEDEDKPLIARLAKIVVRNNNNKRPRSTTTKKKSDVECGVDEEGVAIVRPDKKPPRRPRVETKSAGGAQSNSAESLATVAMEDAAAL